MNKVCKLCYFWLADNEYGYSDVIKKNIFKKDIIFYDKYSIEYSNYNLNIKINENYIPNFYSIDNKKNNIEITGIIGKNGSGKTALLSFINNCLNKNISFLKEYIIIFEIDGKLNIFHKNCEIKNFEELQKIDYIKINNSEKDFEYSLCYVNRNMSTIYYSQTFNYRNNLMLEKSDNSNYYNISLYNDVKLNFKYETKSSGDVGINEDFWDTRFLDEDFKITNNYLARKNLKYFLERNDFNIKYVALEIPFYSSGKFFFTDDISEKWRFYRNFNNDVEHEDINEFEKIVHVRPTQIEKDIYKKIVQKVENEQDDRNKVKYMLQFATIDFYFQALYGIINNKKYINYTNNIISNININDKTDIIDIIKEIQQKIIYYADKINDIKIESFCPTIKKLNSDCVEIFETIEKLYHTNETKFVLSDRRASSHDDFICKKSPHIVVEKAEFKILEKVLENDNNLFFNLFKIVFQGLSSGQQALLDMFSKFYDIKDKIETNSILVIMDEPELYFHPEWQRQLIYYFIDFFSKYFNNKSIQLIISSNSPYILSDLRMENVILLENNKESKVDNTFGNNIHYLLKDKYFMEFTIGEFSKQKIENALKIINRNKKIDIEKYNELDKIIDSVGDELLRYKLKCMLEEKKYD